jgi:hypothetical protein
MACDRPKIHRNRDQRSTAASAVGTAIGGGPSRVSQRDAIARARCDYFVGCGLMGGAEKRFDDEDACVRDQRGLLDSEWTSASCDAFESMRVNDCVEAVRESDTTSCSATLPAKCRADVLCRGLP